MQEKKGIYKNTFWSFVDTFSVGILQFVVFLVFARLLQPSDFGVFAIAYFFVLLGNIVLSSLVGESLVQKSDCVKQHEDAAFVASLALSFILYISFVLLSGLVAHFYENDLIGDFIRLACLSLMPAAIGIVPHSLLRKRIQFRPIAIASFSSILISGVIGVSMSSWGYGLYGIGAFLIVNTLLRSILLLVFSGYSLRSFPDFKYFNEIAKYGVYLMGASSIDCVFRSLYSFVVGKLYLFAELGYFNQAQRIAEAVSSNINKSVVNFIFPYFSNVKMEEKEKRNYYGNVLNLYTCLSFFITGFFFCFSHEIVLIVLTEKWLPMVFYLKCFMVVAIFFPVHAVNINIIKVSGRSDVVLKLELFKKTIGILLLFVTCLISVKAIVFGRIIQSIFAVFMNSYFSNKILKYNICQQLTDIKYNVYALSISLVLSIMLKSFFNSVHYFVWFVLYALIYLVIVLLFNKNVRNTLSLKGVYS